MIKPCLLNHRRPNCTSCDLLPDRMGTGRKFLPSASQVERDCRSTPGPSYVPPPFNTGASVRGRFCPAVSRSGHREVPDVGRALRPGVHDQNVPFRSRRTRVDGPGAGKYVPDSWRLFPSSGQSVPAPDRSIASFSFTRSLASIDHFGPLTSLLQLYFAGPGPVVCCHPYSFTPHSLTEHFTAPLRSGGGT
jgi:hypothetical protein